MKKEEFDAWFVEHLEIMTEMGIMHYNSERAKEIHAVLKILYPEISELRQRIEKLEAKKKRVKKND